MRIFKLSKSWKKLRLLLQTIFQSLSDISSFSVLLFLLIFIYVLLGMELFAQPVTETEIISSDGYVFMYPRYNFNFFLSGFITIFTVLTSESWDKTMFGFARNEGYPAVMFFVSFIVIGVMIFLNLFLAILIDNFTDSDEGGEE